MGNKNNKKRKLPEKSEMPEPTNEYLGPPIPYPEKPVGSDRWTGSDGYMTNLVGFYKPSKSIPFPCERDSTCTLNAPKCKEHGGLFVVYRDDSENEVQIEIPSRFQCFGWYAERIEEVTGIPTSEMRLILAGAQIPFGKLHGGIQKGSKITMIRRRKEK